MGTRRAALIKVVLLSQLFKFCDISEIKENILFLFFFATSQLLTVTKKRAPIDF